MVIFIMGIMQHRIEVNLVDARHGGVAFFDTRAALAWDDTHLYVGAWLQERDVWTTGEERGGLVWQENTFEVFLAADGALYQLSINEYDKIPGLIEEFMEDLEEFGPNPFKGF